MEKDKIIEIVNSFLIEEFELEASELQEDALLRDDLEIESLDFVDIAVIVEKEFGFKIKGEEMVDIKTLGDLYNYLEKKVNNPE